MLQDQDQGIACARAGVGGPACVGVGAHAGATRGGSKGKTPPGGVESHQALSTSITRPPEVPSELPGWELESYPSCCLPIPTGVPPDAQGSQMRGTIEAGEVKVSSEGYPCAGGCGRLGEKGWMCEGCWGEPKGASRSKSAESGRALNVQGAEAVQSATVSSDGRVDSPGGS